VYSYKEEAQKAQKDMTSSGLGGGGRHWGAWSSKSTVASHDESMVLTQDLQKNCSSVMVMLRTSPNIPSG